MQFSRNFQSNILRQITLQKQGYDPIKLTSQSHRKIWATCRVCGNPHRCQARQYFKRNTIRHKQCKSKQMLQCGSIFSKKQTIQKIKNTNIQKYGYSCALLNKDIKQKKKKTNIQRYGHQNPFGSIDIKKKIKKTNIQRYGVQNPATLPQFISKQQTSCIEKYGVKRALQNNSIKSRQEDTSFYRYGCRHAMNNEDIALKHKYSMKCAMVKNCNNKFNAYNAVNHMDQFWKDLSNMTLSQMAKKYDSTRDALGYHLNRPQNIQRYHNTYKYPRLQLQTQVFNYVKTITSNSVLFNDRKTISPLQLDIYIPSLKLAIQFNGQYWHRQQKNSKLSQNVKYNLCANKDIKLIVIWQQQWTNFRSFMQSKISYEITNMSNLFPQFLI